MDAPALRALLLRGSVVAAANWPVVMAQAIAESIVKALAGIPLAGAAVLLLLLSVPNTLPAVAPAVGPVRDGAARCWPRSPPRRPPWLAVAASAVVAALGATCFGAAIRPAPSPVAAVKRAPPPSPGRSASPIFGGAGLSRRAS